MVLRVLNAASNVVGDALVGERVSSRGGTTPLA